MFFCICQCTLLWFLHRPKSSRYGLALRRSDAVLPQGGANVFFYDLNHSTGRTARYDHDSLFSLCPGPGQAILFGVKGRADVRTIGE
jgi:hypothetical protein